MGFIKQTLHKSATAFATGSPRSLRVAVQLVGEEHLSPVHLDLFVVAVQLGDEEHQPPVHLNLFVVAVQLGDEEHQLPVHLDLFVVAVQLGNEEHQLLVHLDLFRVLRLLFEPVAFHHPANGPIYVVDEVQVLPVHFLANPMYKTNLRKKYEKKYIPGRKVQKIQKTSSKIRKWLLCFD
jgi:hypothetical protein